MEKQNIKQRFRISWKTITLILGITAIALTLIFTKLANPYEIWNVLDDYPTTYLLLAILAVCLSWFVDAFRVRTLALSTGLRLSFPQLLITMIGTHFITMVTPFTAGGVPFLIFILYHHGVSTGKATGIITSASLAAQIGLFMLVSAVLGLMTTIPEQILPYFTYLRWIILIYGLIITIIIAVIYRGKRFRHLFQKFSRFPNISQWYDSFIETFRHTFIKSGFYFGSAVLSGFCYFGLLYLAGSFLLTGFQINPSFSFDNYSMATLLGISSSFTPIPGGAGVSEIFSYYMLDDTFPDDRLGAFIILWRLVVFYFPIVVGGLAFAYLIMWSKNKKQKKLGEK